MPRTELGAIYVDYIFLCQSGELYGLHVLAASPTHSPWHLEEVTQPTSGQ